MNTEAYNTLFLHRVAAFLNECPDAITRLSVRETAKELGVSDWDAYLVLLAGAMDVYDDRTLRERYLRESVRRLAPDEFLSDPYRKTVRFPSGRDGAWSFGTVTYRPYELFVCSDMVRMFDGRVLPQLGCFTEPFACPAIFEDGREWMSLKPNELVTMRKPIEKAHGDIAVYGLGLGYFAFMASEKPEVLSVTVAERDEAVLRLFRDALLPQFPHADKIALVHSDAFDYAKSAHRHDFVFADLWHDVSDGLPLWERLRALERPGTEYAYWIEDTMKLYR